MIICRLKENRQKGGATTRREEVPIPELRDPQLLAKEGWQVTMAPDTDNRN